MNPPTVRPSTAESASGHRARRRHTKKAARAIPQVAAATHGPSPVLMGGGYSRNAAGGTVSDGKG